MLVEQTMLLTLENLNSEAFLGLATFLNGPMNLITHKERMWVTGGSEDRLLDYSLRFARTMEAQEQQVTGLTDVIIEVKRTVHVEGHSEPYFVPQKHILGLFKAIGIFTE
jgi:hypothetical protein